MKLALIGIILPFLLSGCSNDKVVETKIETQIVKVPVYKEKEFPRRELPILPIFQLKDNSSYQDTVISYDKSINILMNEIKIYRNMIYKEENDLR